MQSCSNTKKDKVTFIALILKQLRQLVQMENLQQISKHYISISKKILRLLKVIPICSIDQSLKVLISECLQILTVITQASQFYKYGHRYPNFMYILRQYQNQDSKNFNIINSTKFLNITQKIETCDYRKNMMEINTNQIHFLQSRQSNQITQILISLAANEVVLQNPQCVCCSQVFIRQFKIQNKNPLFPVCIEFSKQQSMNKAQILKNICAIYNQGGGVIIIGAERKNQLLYANGIRFKSQEQIMDLEKQIRLLTSQIKPDCHCRIQRIRLHSNFTIQNINIEEQKLRLCIRIIILPTQSCKLSYIQFKNKGFHPSYEIYRYDCGLIPIKVDNLAYNDGKNNGIGVYQSIHKKYFSKNPQNCHKSIKCFRPYEDFSQYYKIYCTKNTSNIETQQITQIVSINQNSVQEIYKDELKFKYKYTSIIVVGASKSKRLIQLLTQYLNQTKQPFQIFKCFPDSFEGAARTVWMLSHTQIFNDVKNKMNALAELISLKPGAILIMRVHKYLHIDKTKITQNSLSHIQKKFHLRFNQEIPFQIVDIIDNKNGEKRKMVEFTFNNLNEAIFAYMIFEQLQLRPYFMMLGSQQKYKPNY